MSADARWRWDGTRWAPTLARRRSRMWLRVLAGCSTVFVLSAVGGGYWIYSYVQSLKSGAVTCLPSDFPKYPGAVYGGETYDMNNTYPGSTCQLVLESNDDVATVMAFYQSKLSIGAWQVTSSGSQEDRVNFQPAKSDAPFGTVQFAVRNTRTQITIDTFTST